MRIEVIVPHGFCGGVERALKMAYAALDEFPPPVYCLHEIVHNERVVGDLAARGMRFVSSVDDVPDAAVMLISAHGAAPAISAVAQSRHIRVVDATCPFVVAAHGRIRANFAQGRRTAVVGDPNHAEVLGYLGEPGACLPEEVRPGEEVGRVVQTTLDSTVHGGVCTATADRQQAVRAFVQTRQRDGTVGVLVVGGGKSANTGRLVETAAHEGGKAWRVASAADVGAIDFSGIDVLGVTSGASTPENILEEVLRSIPS